MSEYLFGVSKSKPSRLVARRMREIAKRHGCYLVEAILPGTGYQRWFGGPNHGYPHDRDMEQRVYADLAADPVYADHSVW